MIQKIEETSQARPLGQPVLADPIVWLVLGVIFVGSTIPFFIPVTLPIFNRELGAILEQMGLMQVAFYISAISRGGVKGAEGWK